jgi:hypothetical protein
MTDAKTVAELAAKHDHQCDIALDPMPLETVDYIDALEALIAELEAENARLREYISKDAPRIEHLHRQSCLTLSGTQMMALDTWVGGWIYEARAALEGQGDE